MTGGDDFKNYTLNPKNLLSLLEDSDILILNFDSSSRVTLSQLV